MHLLPIQRRSLDEEAAAVDLDRSPADVVFLSFSDGDLAVAAAAWAQDRAVLPSLRLVNLARLKHPYSVDLFLEKTVAHARFVLVRLLGGLDYWRYGVEELARAARRYGFALAILPGDQADGVRLEAFSTVAADDLQALGSCLAAGGAENMRQALRRIANHLGADLTLSPARPVPPAGLHHPTCRTGSADAPHILILFYRSALLAADIEPVMALADALAKEGARVSSFFVASLKDPASADTLELWLEAQAVDVILNTTAFSAQRPEGCVTDRAGAPVLQVVLSGADRESWDADTRGLGAADLAMNVVLPEVDGRLAGGVASFKTEGTHDADLEFACTCHQPDPERIGRVADRALAWARLHRTPRDARRLACILSDYPGKTGRVGQAVGLDTFLSVERMIDHLASLGFDCPRMADPAALPELLTESAPQPCIALDEYRTAFAALPEAFKAAVIAEWGEPSGDPDCVGDAFRYRVVRTGKLVLAVQPDRGRLQSRRGDYHDATLPPRHGYIAFYLWLRHAERIDAMIHMGTHGTLEWLSGKAVALSAACAPEVLIGVTPVVYPFIVSNPGEAAQAKRRIGAVTVGHLAPPLVEAGLHGETAELEQLFDEYAEAMTLDPRRARHLASAILTAAHDAGFTVAADRDNAPDAVLTALDAWLCDLKEARIGDGLHVFGEVQLDRADEPEIAACGPMERAGLVAALDGRFVPPGPSGMPWAGRTDVLPTGRNMFTVDPRAIPTRTGWEIGARMAEELVTRHAQDHGEWPRSVVLDLWGSSTMRTGGQDLAQAFGLIGVRPTWDHASNRVTGFEILPLARLGRSRVDVTLRISGLFRDTFPEQIALFDAAVRALAQRDETAEDNPLTESCRSPDSLLRVFGAAPGAYGAGLQALLTADDWATRDDLGAAYLAATPYAYGRAGTGQAAPDAFRARVAAADAFSHVSDLVGQDLLESDVFAEHEGGFAAAAESLGAAPILYRTDITVQDRPKVRSLAEEIERAVLARATNPRWIAGQMRHGYAGASVLAETLDALYGFAATTDAVPSRHFDRFFDATLGDDAIRAALVDANPAAVRGMAARFEAAIRRGFWISRRNSTQAILAEAGGSVP